MVPADYLGRMYIPCQICKRSPVMHIFQEYSYKATSSNNKLKSHRDNVYLAEIPSVSRGKSHNRGMSYIHHRETSIMSIIAHSAISHLSTRNVARSITARNVTPVLNRQYLFTTFRGTGDKEWNACESILSSCYIPRRTLEEPRRGYILTAFRETPDGVVTFQYFSFFYPSCLNVYRRNSVLPASGNA